MRIDAEALKLIQGTAQAALDAKAKAAVLDLPGHRFALVTAAGIGEIFDEPPEPRSHELRSLESVIAFARHHGAHLGRSVTVGFIDGPDEGNTEPRPAAEIEAELAKLKDVVVWYESTGIVVILDDAVRRDRATLELKLHPTFVLLQEIAKKKYDQRSFRRLLRIDLGPYTRTADLPKWVSAVDFKRDSLDKAERTRGSESFGKAVKTEVMSAAGECPEELILDVPIFDDPSLVLEKEEVVCAVEILFDENSFQLIPYPGQLQLAIDGMVDIIGRRLRESLGCPVFRGVP